MWRGKRLLRFRENGKSHVVTGGIENDANRFKRSMTSVDCVFSSRLGKLNNEKEMKVETEIVDPFPWCLLNA
jgi:hypothetical protein